MQRIIEENGLDSEYHFGQMMRGIKLAYKGKSTYVITKEERKEAEELGLVETEEKKSAIAEMLEVARILKANGVDLSKLKLTKMENKKQVYRSLGELEQDGVDIQRIIEENGLDSAFPFASRMCSARNVYNGKGRSLITEDEKREVERLGLATTSRSKTRSSHLRCPNRSLLRS